MQAPFHVSRLLGTIYLGLKCRDAASFITSWDMDSVSSVNIRKPRNTIEWS